MIRPIKTYGILLLMVFAAACSGGGDGGGTPNPPPDGGGNGNPDPDPDPKAATLVFPEDESECLEGEVIDLQNSEVTFEWNPAEDADYYQLEYTNLESGVTLLKTSDTNTATVTLLRGTPYSWSVISRANGSNASATSEEWRFYNQGPGIENYAPFPAQAVYPGRGETLSNIIDVDLIWEGSDVDGDLDFYEVFFSTSNPPETLTETTEQDRISVTVSSGNTYYWRVRSVDAFGNSSTSETFEFRID